MIKKNIFKMNRLLISCLLFLFTLFLSHIHIPLVSSIGLIPDYFLALFTTLIATRFINMNIYIYFLIGLIIIFVILLFVRKKSLEPMYSFIWILIGIFFILVSFFPNIIYLVSILLGIEFSPIGVLVISIFGLGSIILHLSTIITKHQRKIREFEKKIALLENEKSDN